MKKQGFTLIELLVVIGIIAVLTGLALPNYMGARERARDAKRKAELHELKSALRLYYNDYQGYPDSSNGSIMGCGDGTQACPAPGQPNAPFTTNSTTYMKQLPLEYTYERDSTTDDDFRLSVSLENASDSDIAGSQSRCPTFSGDSWELTDYVVCAD